MYLIDRRVRLGKLSPALLSQLLAMREVLVRRADAEFESQADDSTFTAAQQQVLRKLTGKALISQRETFRVEAQRKAHREALAALAKSPTTPQAGSNSSAADRYQSRHDARAGSRVPGATYGNGTGG